jgi:hypothetical protein
MKLDTSKYALPHEQQRAAILKDLEVYLDHIDLNRNRVMVATYVEPAITSGGIMLPPKTLDESRFQGKAGLLIAKGPLAFKWDDPEGLESPEPEIGDWIFYRASDTFECGFAGVYCRMIFDDMVIGKVESPELIF